jgi:hypothetical protein
MGRFEATSAAERAEVDRSIARSNAAIGMAAKRRERRRAPFALCQSPANRDIGPHAATRPSSLSRRARLGGRFLASHFARWLVLTKPHKSRLPQKSVVRPGQIGDLGDKLGADPTDL